MELPLGAGIVMNTETNIPLLEVHDLKKYFPAQKKFLEKQAPPVRAVDGISFALKAGETLGLVGESGCGKSTAARTLLRLIEPTSGQVNFFGTNLFALKETEMRNLRREMQIIFQDPYSSVNPARRIGNILQEPFEIHGFQDKKENAEKATQLLEHVGLTPGHFNRYPHELSGGQLQRVGIARATPLKRNSAARRIQGAFYRWRGLRTLTVPVRSFSLLLKTHLFWTTSTPFLAG